MLHTRQSCPPVDPPRELLQRAQKARGAKCDRCLYLFDWGTAGIPPVAPAETLKERTPERSKEVGRSWARTRPGSRKLVFSAPGRLLKPKLRSLRAHDAPSPRSQPRTKYHLENVAEFEENSSSKWEVGRKIPSTEVGSWALPTSCARGPLRRQNALTTD